jgi:hypothetical protein
MLSCPFPSHRLLNQRRIIFYKALGVLYYLSFLRAVLKILKTFFVTKKGTCVTMRDHFCICRLCLVNSIPSCALRITGPILLFISHSLFSLPVYMVTLFLVPSKCCCHTPRTPVYLRKLNIVQSLHIVFKFKITSL